MDVHLDSLTVEVFGKAAADSVLGVFHAYAGQDLQCSQEHKFGLDIPGTHFFMSSVGIGIGAL